jgi:hypothetical protein
MKMFTTMGEKFNKKDVLAAARRNGIWNFVELARRIGCSRTAVHLVFERPSRFPRVRSRIKELTGV